MSFFSRLKVFVLSCICITMISGCYKDLSTSTYDSSSTSTIGAVLKGKVLSRRNVLIKEKEAQQLDLTNPGGISGGLLGAFTGSKLGTSDTAIVLSGATGATLGALIERKFKTNHNGVEYIVKVDVSKIKQSSEAPSKVMRQFLSNLKISDIVTIVQPQNSKKSADIVIGQNVLIIISGDRVRILPDF